MNDSQIRQLIQQEIHKANQLGRFNLKDISHHAHTGEDSPRVSQSDVVPGLRAEGSITFAQATTYKLGITFNPSSVWVHGNVVGSAGEKFLVVGNAQLGPSFYMQPASTTSTTIGGPQQTIIQSTSYFGGTSGAGGVLHTLVDEGHIVDIFYGGTIHARATINKYDSTGIYVTVDNLDASWDINLSWTVT